MQVLNDKGLTAKIEDINAQASKLDERIAKADEQVAAAQQRMRHLVDRHDELIKAKYALADEIAEHLTPEDHERLGLDQPENVTDNTPLTPEQVEAVAESAHEAEEQDTTVEESENKTEDKEEVDRVADEAPATAKPTRTRAKKQ